MKNSFKYRKKLRLFFSKLKKSEKKSDFIFWNLKNSKNRKQIHIYFKKTKSEINFLKIKIK